ncbi:MULTISPECIES: hypothetical protein [unclassified Pseudoxanthomonas]|uniref:hypothetical protein n=1 Tax=unclassified Pseudoxanthomonas TaxID=2645906 RepID=UPI001616C2C7|nr:MULTISPECIES: hypothetical protein [unclassified Pseudoxanthomonas]MBB3275939.1 hypothetical protein [Pseudoxanthomonas sp. OG2]MBV7472979.1 hypothetical protein [Pseudoxanthomonas sp. PXM05]
MKCYVFVDCNMVDGRHAGFAAGMFDLSRTPQLNDYLSIGSSLEIGKTAKGMSFKVSEVRVPGEAVKASSDIEWMVSCDEDVFHDSDAVERSAQALERMGFVSDPASTA